MRKYVAGWVDRDGKFTCVECAEKHRKGPWVLRLAMDCIVHNQAKKSGRRRRTG